MSHGYVFQRLLVATPTITELALDLGITQQGASKSVAELETLGYVERRVAGHDNRVRTVHLTDQGHQAIAAGRAVRAEFLDRLRQAVSADELAGATQDGSSGGLAARPRSGDRGPFGTDTRGRLSHRLPRFSRARTVTWIGVPMKPNSSRSRRSTNRR